MRVRALDYLGDWTFGKGQNDYLTANRAIAQNLKTRLYSILGDCFFDLGAGIDWFTFLGSKDQLSFRLALASVILNTEGVTSMLELSVVLTPDRLMTITYNVATIYAGTISGSITTLITQDGLTLTTESGDEIITEGS